MAKRPVDPFSGLMLWAMYASGLMVLLATSVAAGVIGTGWSWPIFAAGVASAAAMVLLNHLTLRFAWRRMIARLHPTDERRVRGRDQLHKRQRIYPVLFTMGVGIAVLGAGLQSYWPVLAFLILWVLLVVVLPMALLPRVIRRVERAR
jgi:hypothetical protein